MTEYSGFQPSRLEAIKAELAAGGFQGSDNVRWLVAEVERLRETLEFVASSPCRDGRWQCVEAAEEVLGRKAVEGE